MYLPPLISTSLKYLVIFIGCLLLIFSFQRVTRPDTISFAISHEELTPVGKISAVVQFTSRQVEKAGLITSSDYDYSNFLAQVSAIPNASYQESAAQLTQIGTGYQYVKTIRIDLSDPAQYAALKKIFDSSSIQIIQTIYTPSQEATANQNAYNNLLKKSREQGKNIAKASGKQLGGIVSMIEAAPQLREGSSNFTSYSADGTLQMNITKTATFQYGIY